MQIPSELVFQNSIVAYNASVFIISMISRLQTYIALSSLKAVHCPRTTGLGLLIFQPRQTDFSEVSVLQSILLLQLGTSPLLMMYANSSFLQFPFFKY